MVGSFYDPELDEGCAFEELISFHGGIGGPQTRPFILHPAQSRGAARARSSAPPACTASSPGWRRQLQAATNARRPGTRCGGALEQDVGGAG